MSRKDKKSASNDKDRRKNHQKKSKDFKSDRQQTSDQKLKKSLHFAIRKLFEQKPNAILTYKEVGSILNIEDNELRKLVYNVLVSEAKDDFLIEKPHGSFALNTDIEIIQGNIELTARGAGYVVIAGREDDVYIAPQNTNQALHGDLVSIRLFPRKGEKQEGLVLDVLKREKTFFVGTLDLQLKFGFCVADNAKTGIDVFIPLENLNGAKHGDKIMVKITSWPKSTAKPYGEVLEVLGRPGSNDAEMLSVLYANDIDPRFPDAVLAEAEQVGMALDPIEVATRRDFRKITTFTIDPVDAKDFDDAISFLDLPNGNYEIGVHIADVSHYVRPKTAMDEEALKRGNSTYLVDRVVPMLPEQLSNLACSLRPHEEKFTFSAVFEITPEGEIKNEWFGKTVIYSDHRFSYEEAQEIIEGAEGPYKREIHILDGIAKIHRGIRLKHGAMNIESEELRFVLDEERKPIKVISKVSKDAHKLVEEFMLLANKHVALFIAKPHIPQKVQIPFVYRCHDEPDAGKIQVFKDFIEKFGCKFTYTQPREISKSMNKLFNEVRGTSEFAMIQSMAVRSMAKAVYDTQNIGHYGLAFEHYTHFTSPIRRYADLLVHRVLQEELTTKQHKYGATMSDMCKRISRTERKSVEAERESTKYFQCVFVKDQIGEIFEGTVSGVSEYGMFVKMKENHCEGMVSLQNIKGDRYSFDPKKHQISGQRHGETFNLGDTVMVKIFDVNTRKRQIDLELMGDY
jgi:ribonuclease R